MAPKYAELLFGIYEAEHKSEMATFNGNEGTLTRESSLQDQLMMFSSS